MNIAIIGIGGVGGYFGGKLSKGKSEELQIYFVARGEHGKKIRENGLVLKTSAERKDGYKSFGKNNKE